VRQKPVYLACFLLHFLLIVTVSSRETLWLIARGLTIFPSPFKSYAPTAGTEVATVPGQNRATVNPLRRAVVTYLHIAGIERGYGYFAPNVPAAYKLIFELHYTDGRVEYRLPRVHSAAAGIRLAGLLDEIGRTGYDPLREYLVKMLARPVWREHPEATTISAVFGSINLPSVNEFEHGARESYQFLYAYDFSVRDEAAESENR
jgi:hypothetical protein